MFKEMITASYLKQALRPAEAFRPFPILTDRAAWEGLPADLKAARIALAEERLAAPWPALPATLYLDFSRTGNRTRFETAYFSRRRALTAFILAECIEARGRFLDPIADACWSICEESGWVLPAHNWSASGNQLGLPEAEAPIFDLFAGDTAGLLATCLYLMPEEIASICPLLGARIRKEVALRVLDPFLTRTDYWWMGMENIRRLNNWTPWCCSNAIHACLFLETDTERRHSLLVKAASILDRFLATYAPDGGCDEGPLYWGKAGASLFDCLEALYRATDGGLDFYAEPLIRAIGGYIAKVHIADDYFLNFSDNRPRVEIPASVALAFGRRVDDADLEALGRSTLSRWMGSENIECPEIPFRMLLGFFPIQSSDGTGPATPASLITASVTGSNSPSAPAIAIPRDLWMDGVQIMAAREAADTHLGLYVGAKGGHNGESHNHNDVGQFLIYSDGHPVVVDPGVESYSAATFSSGRYSLWTMQSAYHNLPTIGDLQQREGEEFAARDVEYACGDTSAALSMELAGTYPATAGIRSWRREIRLERPPEAGAKVTLREHFLLDGAKSGSLSSNSLPLRLTLMCAHQPGLLKPGLVELPAGPGRPLHLQFDAAAFGITVEAMDLEDHKLRKAWGPKLYRLLLTYRGSESRGEWLLSWERKPGG